MSKPIRILLQTTVPSTNDDWNIDRLSMLRDYLVSLQDLDPDLSQHCIDDTGTPTISWPNYYSGRNGDYQRITPVEPIHPLLRNSAAPSGANAKRATKAVELFPAHPHEGAVGVPAGSKARVIATGISGITGRSFNLVVAIDRAETTDGESPGRVIAQSTFHHFADYNWSIAHGCPSFVTEPAGDGMQTEPSALADIHAYVQNLVAWLAPVPVGVASPLENRVIVEANRDENLRSEIIPNARLQTLDRVGTFK